MFTNLECSSDAADIRCFSVHLPYSDSEVFNSTVTAQQPPRLSVAQAVDELELAGLRYGGVRVTGFRVVDPAVTPTRGVRGERGTTGESPPTRITKVSYGI